MENVKDFTISIRVPDGVPGGFRIVDTPNSDIRTFICPRGIVMEKKEKFNLRGVYILRSEEDWPITIYIGEGNLLDRFKMHDKDKKFWRSVVMFTSKVKEEPLSMGLIKYLESELIKLAKESQRCKLENKSSPATPLLSDQDKSTYRGYLNHILSILSMIGLDVFEAVKSEKTENNVLTYRAKRGEWDACGHKTSSGFLVYKNSLARIDTVASLKRNFPSVIRFRNSLIEQGVLVETDDKRHYKFTKDYEFTTSSRAATVCSGANSNKSNKWTKK